MSNRSIHIHSVEKAGALESSFRYRFQNPRKILKKHIHTGMTVIDLGCGTGFFTLEIGNLVGNKGKVFACDVQNGMIEILKHKLTNSELNQHIIVLNNQEDSLGLKEKVDFVFAFYSFHEMRSIDSIIYEISKILKPETKILISEQKLHVSKNAFDSIIQKMENNGYEICERPFIFLSRTVIMMPKQYA